MIRVVQAKVAVSKLMHVEVVIEREVLGECPGAEEIVVTDYLLKLLEVPTEILLFPDHGHSQSLWIRR